MILLGWLLKSESILAIKWGHLHASSSGGGSFFLSFLCSVVVVSKSGLGLELATAGVKVSMIWSLTSVVRGL